MPHAERPYLLLGCGDIAQRIGQRLRSQGKQVLGLARSEHNLLAATRLGITPLALDLDALTSMLPEAEAVFYCAPPANNGQTDTRILQALSALPSPKLGVLYLSTSAVYGDCQGRWIDETEPLKPQTDRGHRRVYAEQTLTRWGLERECKTVCLRVPGIYSAGRLPLQRLHAGTPVLRQADSPYSNRIHADDLADAAILALAQGQTGAAYNVSDGNPTTMSDYFLQCAKYLQLPAPAEITLAEAKKQFSANLISYFEESKRLDIDKIQALGFAPRYPNLALGLKQCLAEFAQ